MMTKLMVWSMDEYEKVVYLDSDLIVLRSMDELWEHTVHFGQILAPARSYSDPQNFGAYLMLLHPGVVRGALSLAIVLTHAWWCVLPAAGDVP